MNFLYWLLLCRYWCLAITADLQVALTIKKASDHTPYLQKVALGAQNHLQQKKQQQMGIPYATAAAKNLY